MQRINIRTEQNGIFEALREEGRCDILAYGIAFHKKRCKVVMLEK